MKTVFFLVITLAISIYDIVTFKENLKKTDIALYLVLMAISVALFALSEYSSFSIGKYLLSLIDTTINESKYE